MAGEVAQHLGLAPAPVRGDLGLAFWQHVVLVDVLEISEALNDMGNAPDRGEAAPGPKL